MLRVRETSNFWLADGTFKVTPKMFYQLYSIHVSLSGIAPACIYAFLPNKTEKTYHRFLEALKILVPDSRPEKILLDFEQAAIQAFQKNIPETKLSGCFFHLSQSFMRKIGELGLKKDYETNHEFALALKMLPALAFEKEEKIGNSYDKIVEEIQIVCDRTLKESEKIAKVDELCLYFGSNYIKSLSRIGKPYSPLHYGIKGMRHHRVWPEQQMLLRAGIMAYSHTSVDRIPVYGK